MTIEPTDDKLVALWKRELAKAKAVREKNIVKVTK